VNTNAQLNAMKTQGADTQAAAQMNQGWLKPLEGIVGTLGGAAGGAGQLMTGINS